MLFFAFMLLLSVVVCLYRKDLGKFEVSVRVARLLVNYRGLLFYLVFVVIVFVSVVCTNYGSL